jgi:CheY-like chemotaxis protein
VSIGVETFACQILKAKTRVKAIDKCHKHSDIDLVMMIFKCLYCGYEATQQIRAFNDKVIIIGQIASVSTGNRQKSIKAGCNDYISKSISDLELQDIILKHFKNKMN